MNEIPPTTMTTTTTTSTTGLASPPILQVDSLSAGYGNTEVLHDVNLSVNAGEVFGLLGPNGAGKTTLLSVCGGQILPTAGSVRLMGHEVNGASPQDLAQIGVCMVPERAAIFDNLTVLENLQMATFTGTDLATITERAFYYFPTLRLHQAQLAGTLSGGERHMLAIARALTTDPKLVLIDELSFGLAPIVVTEIYEHLAEMANAGVAVLLVEQFSRNVMTVAHRAAVLLGGSIHSEGEPDVVALSLAAIYLSGSVA